MINHRRSVPMLNASTCDQLRSCITLVPSMDAKQLMDSVTGALKRKQSEDAVLGIVVKYSIALPNSTVENMCATHEEAKPPRSHLVKLVSRKFVPAQEHLHQMQRIRNRWTGDLVHLAIAPKLAVSGLNPETAPTPLP